MGQVVLVTGVAGDLGRRFAAQLSRSPGVERVIGIDVVPPRGDLGRGRLRPRRHPQPRDRQGDRPRARRHRRAHQRRRHPGRGRWPHLDEGAQRHRDDAAPRGVPAGARRTQAGGQVERRGLRRLQPRPGHVHRGHERQAAGHERLRQGHHRGRVLHARLRPPPSRRRGHHAADRQRHRPADHLGDDRLLPAAGDPDRPRLQPAAAVRPRAGRPRRARARHRHATSPAPSTSPATASSPSPRPYAASAGPRSRSPASPSRRFGSAIRQTRGRRLLAGAGGLPDLRPRPRHHPDALDARLRAEVHHRRGLRRLRRLADPRYLRPRAGAGHRVALSSERSTSGKG